MGCRTKECQIKKMLNITITKPRSEQVTVNVSFSGAGSPGLARIKDH